MKKISILGILLLVLVSNIAVAKKIEVWAMGYTNELIKVAESIAAREFTPKTGIEVKFVPLTWQDTTKIFLALISNDAPEIISGSIGNIVEFGIRGSILDLKKTFGNEFDDLTSQFFPAVTEPLNFLGTNFGIPQNISIVNAAYRTDIFSEMGFEMPTLWSDLYTIMPKLKAKNKEAGFSYGSPDSGSVWGAYTLISQHGGSFFDQEKFQSGMDSPQSIRGFKEFIELYTKYKMPTSSPGIAAFRTGDWAMFIDAYTMYPNLIVGAPEINGKWAPALIPGTKRDDGVINHGTFSGATCFGIPKSTAKQKEAWEFLKWFCSTPVQKMYTDEVTTKIKGYMQVPSSRDALYNMTGIPLEIARTIHAQIEESKAVAYAPTAAVLNRFVHFAIHSCLQLGKDPESEARNAASEMNHEINKRKVEYKRFLDQLDKEN